MPALSLSQPGRRLNGQRGQVVVKEVQNRRHDFPFSYDIWKICAFVISVLVTWAYGATFTFSSAFTPTNLRQFFHFLSRQVKIRPVVHWFGAKLLIEGDC